MDSSCTDQRVDDIIRSPLGCLFLLEVDAIGLMPEALADPQTCFWLAYEDLLTLDRNNSSGNPFIVAEVLERGRALAPLARSIVEHPGTSWWFEDIDLNHQLWLAHDGVPPNTEGWTPPTSPPDRWERYAQKPYSLQCTSTLYGNTVSVLASNNMRAGPYMGKVTLACWHVQVDSDVQVYEVHGPRDWHELCVRYPSTFFTGSYDEDRLVPDWGAAAVDWDAVHLSFGGLLTCEQRVYELDGNWSKHETWHAEQTYWFTSIETLGSRLPDHHRDLRPDVLGDEGVVLRSEQWPLPYDPGDSASLLTADDNSGGPAPS